MERLREISDDTLSDYERGKTAAMYLTKYEAYDEISDRDKKILSEFIQKFDEEDEIDRAVMKYLVSEKYINEETEIVYKNKEVEIPVIFAPSAKQAIFERYKYPKCIDYMSAFEFAMGRSANTAGSSGIKHIGSNNDKITGYEVKISMDKDRLYSSEDRPYYFDQYDYYGLHD